MVLTATAAVLVLIVVAGGLAVDRIGSLFPTESASTGARQIWDPSADLGIASKRQNPGPDSYGNLAVWSYLRSPGVEHNPASYFLLPDFANSLPEFGFEVWYDGDFGNLLVGWGANKDAIYLHPWSDGAIRKHAILGWTSPISGPITIEGVIARAQHTCPEPAGSIFFSVDRGAESLKKIVLALGQSAKLSLTTSVSVGESLYFVVDAGADASCDGTELRLKIEY